MRKFISYPAARLSIAYLIVAGFWVFLSDRALSLVISDPVLLTQLQSIKGIAFVLVMALLLYAERLSSERANQRAQQKTQQMADIVRSSQDAIISLGPDGRITSWNPAATAIYGYTPKEVEGAHISMLVAPDHAGEMAQQHALVFRGESISQYETVHCRQDGTPIDVALSESALRDHSGQIIGITSITRDITERKRMIERLQEQQAELKAYAHRLIQSQEDERKRLSRELHDDTLQDLVALSQRAELSRTAIERDAVVAARRLEELQLLAKQMVVKLRRLSNDLRPLILEDLGIAAALQFLADELSRQMPYCTVRCEVTGDERRLNSDVEVTVFRIVQQALANVRQHAPGATQVNVNLTFAESEVHVVVNDNGPGFTPPDSHDLLRQGHLGLAGMRERATLLGGKIDIESSPGHGATIKLCLPYAHEPVYA